MEASEKYQRGGAVKHRTGYFSPARRDARKRKRKTRKYNKKRGKFCTENSTAPECVGYAKYGAYRKYPPTR
jgi:hypothetical protein